MSGDHRASARISEVSGRQSTTPSAFPDTNFGFIQPYIRGIVKAIFLGADPCVDTFVDDVPQIYGAMIDSLSDVERIEVLKGSQVGLYGRNATAGVINIITRKQIGRASCRERVCQYV